MILLALPFLIHKVFLFLRLKGMSLNYRNTFLQKILVDYLVLDTQGGQHMALLIKLMRIPTFQEMAN